MYCRTAAQRLGHMDAAYLATAMAITAVGAALQASIGFGFALLLVPVLALIDVDFVPAPTLMANLALVALVAWRGRGLVPGSEVRVAAAGLAAGTAAGLAALSLVGPQRLPTMIGALILVAVAASLLDRDVALTRVNLAAGCAVSAVMGTMAGIHGPFIALLYQRVAPERLRATVGTIYGMAYSIALTGLAAAGLIGMRQVWLGLALMPGVLAGFLVAPLLTRHLDGPVMRWTILALSAASAIVLIVRG